MTKSQRLLEAKRKRRVAAVQRLMFGKEGFKRFSGGLRTLTQRLSPSQLRRRNTKVQRRKEERQHHEKRLLQETAE